MVVLTNALWSAASAVTNRAYSAQFDAIAICSGFGVEGQEMTREWCRKLLKSLKTDSEVVSRRIAANRHENR
jgi:hypothetical protein